MDDLCNHFNEIEFTESEKEGCDECVAAGKRDWIELRLCLICGHVGCCDNSPGKHATGHFHETGHAMIRGFMKGDRWAYCYPDDLAKMIYFPPLQK